MTSSSRTIVAVLLCLSGPSGNVFGDLILGVTIESFSSQLTLADGFPRDAVHVIDGSGLFGNLHTRDSNGFMWDADTFVPPLSPTGTDTDPEITFDLGAITTVASFQVWNYGDNIVADFTGRGVKEFELLISNDDLDYTSLGNLLLSKVTAFSLYPGEVIDPTDFTARYVRFDILSNHADDLKFGVGLAEVQFTSSAVPEPSSLALSAITLGLLYGYRRRRRPLSMFSRG
jgi:hypothetical protein